MEPAVDGEARFRALFLGAPVGMGICDVHGQIVEVNQALADLLGYSVAELRELNVQQFVHPDDRPDTWDSFRLIAQGERAHSRREKSFRRKDGSVVYTDMTTSLLRDRDGRPQYLVSIMQDITDRHELSAQLRYQAVHDPLTGLPNRRMLFDRMAEVLATAGRIGLCYLDLDGFKAINDNLGHDTGDRILVGVARRVQERAAGLGHLAVRMGGDEFVVLVADPTGTHDVLAVAEQVLDTFAEPFRIGSHELTVSASAGVVDQPVDGTTVAELLREADTTLAWAKAAGKGRAARFDPDRYARELSRQAVARSLPDGIERGEFLLEYQPVVRMSDGALLGAEALLRWRHPQFGLLMPDRFLDVAEETGLVVPLGRWVLAQACQQAARWSGQRNQPAPFVSVNLTPRQLWHPALVGDLHRILDETGLVPGRLQLELTEAAMSTGPDEWPHAVHTLAGTGVRLAVDDFGSGYANLGALCNLPVHDVKLARPLVAGLGDGSVDRPGGGLGAPGGGLDPAPERVVSALVQLAHSLDLTATAEGVETAGQADRLRRLHCDAGQGWWYGRPGPADEALRAGRPARGVSRPARDPAGLVCATLPRSTAAGPRSAPSVTAPAVPVTTPAPAVTAPAAGLPRQR